MLKHPVAPKFIKLINQIFQNVVWKKKFMSAFIWVLFGFSLTKAFKILYWSSSFEKQVFKNGGGGFLWQH